MSRIAGLVSRFVVVIGMFSILVVRGQELPASPGLWEYKAVSFSGLDEKEASSKLAALICDGWEHVGPLATGHVAFRRPANTENNAVEQRQLIGHTHTVCMAAFSSDGELLASASEDGSVKLWNWKVGILLATLEGHTAGVLHVSFSPDGKTLATSSRDKTVILWDVAKKEKRTALDDHNGSVSSALFSPDGKTLTTASDDMLVLVRDANGKMLSKLEGHKQPVIALSYSPDSGKTTRVSSGGDWNDSEKSGEVMAWNLTTGKKSWSVSGEFGGIWGVAYAPDGKTIAGGCLDGTVRLWDAATGKELQILKGHTERVIWVAYTHSGKTLASSSYDGTIRLWDPATTKEKAVLKGHTEGVQRLAFSFGGTNLASTSNDRTIRIWQFSK